MGKIAIQSRITTNFGRGPPMTDAVSERAQGINETDKEAKKDDNFGVLELIYTPGVAVVAEAISSNKELVYDYTSKWNNVAIVSDGTRVLGLGNIGPQELSL
jgi:malate dehydrogenase (oxaloacetate-decarboxylating)